MAHHAIEWLIGRLVLEEAFREAFMASPHAVLQRLEAGGVPLTPTETAALLATAPAVWTETADAIDPRLRRGRS